MPWSSGVFSRLYNFVSDAAAGIKILASKQDDEWNNTVVGFSNVITRDGLAKPTADMDWNGKRLMNLGPASAPTDAVILSQLGTSSGTSWASDSSAAVFVSSEQINVVGNVAAAYTVGRRIRWLTPPATYGYGTVIGAYWVSPNTIIQVAPDNGYPLSAGITTIWHGSEEYLKSAVITLPTAVNIRNAGGQTLAPGTHWFPFDSEVLDYLSEYDYVSSYRFMGKLPATYLIMGNCGYVAQATGTITVSVNLNDNGTIIPLYSDTRAVTSGQTYAAPFCTQFGTLSLSDYAVIQFVNTGISVAASPTSTLSITRITNS